MEWTDLSLSGSYGSNEAAIFGLSRIWHMSHDRCLLLFAQGCSKVSKKRDSICFSLYGWHFADLVARIQNACFNKF